MKKNDGWINALFSLVFIAAPALVIFYFLLPTWTGYEEISYGMIWVVALGFLTYIAILSFALIYFEWLTIESLNFNIPISLALMAILVTYPLPLWAVAIIVVAIVLFAFPINIMVTKYKENKILKRKKSNKGA